ncbi:MAG: DUF3147 family protein [Gammaproteobacteria bacterium]|nr:DUF3147 family protein [Gammaproteobacteria bacterium]
MNLLFVTKVVLSALVIALATEVAKRDSFWGAVVVVLPLTSLLAMSWLYAESHDNELVARFARDILLLVPVSLVFFLPFLFESRTRFGFVPNLAIGLALLALGVLLMRRFLP